jgi:hypothetical protein
MVLMVAGMMLAGCYALLSWVLQRKPELLHTPRQQSFRVVHASHRGGAGEHAENTVTAFDHALGGCRRCHGEESSFRADKLVTR